MSHLTLFEDNQGYDNFVSSEQFLKPNVSYIKGQKKVKYHPRPKPVEPDKPLNPRAKITFSTTAETLTACTNIPNNIKTILVDGENYEFEPFVEKSEVFYITNESFTDDGMLDTGITYTTAETDYILYETINEDQKFGLDMVMRFYIGGVCLMEYPYSVFIAMGENLPFVPSDDGKSVLIEGGMPDSDGMVFVFFNGNGELIETKVTQVSAEGGLKTPLVFSGAGEHTLEFELTNSTLNSLSSLNKTSIISYEMYDLTEIGYGALSSCSNLTSVTIPDSVTIIGNDAFYYCDKLTNIHIPNKVTTIGNNAFYKCSGITGTLIIPNSVKTIGENAFEYCSGITEVSLGTGLTNVAGTAFHGCSSLPVVDNLIYADYILVGVADKTLETYNIKSGTKQIATMAFSNCSAMTEITLIDGVETINSQAFYNCNKLESIFIPKTVKTINSVPFEDCSQLSIIEVDADNIFYDSRENCNGIINTSTNTLVLGCRNTEIPEGITHIGDGAFIGCYTLTNIDIPESVLSLGNVAFQGCTGLTSITLPSTLTRIGEACFGGCTYLEEIIIPDSVTYIGISAFTACEGLTNVILPQNLKEVGMTVFGACESLANLVIPESVNVINMGAFVMAGLSSLTINSGLTTLGLMSLMKCMALTELVLPDTLTSVLMGAFAKTSLKSLTLGAGTKILGQQLFLMNLKSGVTELISLAPIAPAIDSTTFEGGGMATGGTLYCVAGSEGYDAWMEQLSKSGWTTTDIIRANPNPANVSYNPTTNELIIPDDYYTTVGSATRFKMQPTEYDRYGRKPKLLISFKGQDGYVETHVDTMENMVQTGYYTYSLNESAIIAKTDMLGIPENDQIFAMYYFEDNDSNIRFINTDTLFFFD